ncbi:MAG: type ISP restriction/modification enzyme, partial [Bryobacteraceae bacterium]
SLMRSFEQIYVLDLHGNAKKKEHAPNGGKDENVFDIEQGVAISLFVKKPGLERGAWHGELWGSRLNKYVWLAEHEMRKVTATALEVSTPLRMFIPKPRQGFSSNDWLLTDIFGIKTTGMKTHRDDFAIGFQRLEVVRRLTDLVDQSSSFVYEKYKLKKTTSWSAEAAREALSELSDPTRVIQQCYYRPFDIRWCLYGPYVMDRPRTELGENVAGRQNLLLLCPRQTKNDWAVSITDQIPDHKSVSDYDTGYVFPVWSYDSNGRSEDFCTDFRSFIDARYPDQHYTPEEILGTIYAVLHAPTYRTRYADFLRIDFPRIPFPEKQEDFDALSDLGWDLVQVHLLRDVPRRGLAQFEVKGDYTVEKVSWSEAEQAILINNSQRFHPVPKAVWEFHIGGYAVLEKYLKSRKGRKLSLDE